MLKEIKKGIVIALSFAVTLGLIGISYATWLDLTDVDAGTPLSAYAFNKVLENQRDLDSRLNNLETKQIATAWVQFYGNTGNIRDSYNVSSVSYLGTGQYSINFENDMNSTSYVSFADGCSGYDAWTDTETTSSVLAKVRETNSGYHNCGVVSVVVFGGK